MSEDRYHPPPDFDVLGTKSCWIVVAVGCEDLDHVPEFAVYHDAVREAWRLHDAARRQQAVGHAKMPP